MNYRNIATALGGICGVISALLVFGSDGYRYGGGVFASGQPMNFTPLYILPGIPLGLLFPQLIVPTSERTLRVRSVLLLSSVLGHAAAVGIAILSTMMVLAFVGASVVGSALLAGGAGFAYYDGAVRKLILRYLSAGAVAGLLFYLTVASEFYPARPGYSWCAAYAVWQAVMARRIANREAFER